MDSQLKIVKHPGPQTNKPGKLKEKLLGSAVTKTAKFGPEVTRYCNSIHRVEMRLKKGERGEARSNGKRER